MKIDIYDNFFSEEIHKEIYNMLIHSNQWSFAGGDFFVFPASLQHQVYPFRTPDGKGERRSVSFNAEFTSKSEQDYFKKQQMAI